MGSSLLIVGCLLQSCCLPKLPKLYRILEVSYLYMHEGKKSPWHAVIPGTLLPNKFGNPAIILPKNSPNMHKNRKNAAGSKKPISKIYTYMCQKNPENISITQSCARKRSITCCIVQFGGFKDEAFLPSLHQTSNFHEGAQGAEKESHQILLGTGCFFSQAPTPIGQSGEKWMRSMGKCAI